MWQIMRAVEVGAVPQRCTGKGWRREVADELAGRVPEILAAVEAAEAFGANRIAGVLAEAAGVEGVTRTDVELIVEAGHLVEVDEYKGWPLYSVQDAKKWAAEHADELVSMVAERRTWVEASMEIGEAAEELGWSVSEVQRMMRERGMNPGRFGRLARTDIAVLKVDEEAAAQVVADRLIGPERAAEVLEIRRTDWDHVVAAGWIEAAEVIEVPKGRRKTVSIPMYRTGDVEALREEPPVPGLSWEDVRAVPAGRPSPLREYAHRAPSRSTVVHQFAARLAEHEQVAVWAHWDNPDDVWSLEWDRVDGKPTRDHVRSLMADDVAVGQYRAEIQLGTTWGATTRFARAMLEPEAAVLLDTETTALDGQIIEIAILDAATGRPLLDTLVKPTEGVEIDPQAHAVHRLTLEDLADAPPWEKVLPKVRKLTKDRTILAYHAAFDRGRIIDHTEQVGKRPMHLADPDNWWCLMQARSQFYGHGRRSLNGPHRAMGDCRKERELLKKISEGHGRLHQP
ncbi:3'-5' exonuclease [Streptomyces noursei]|uniref:3'-5' exonuclease n=1 Tax=Streptomyces noursei TaxID=1971 RepID=UPI0021A5CD8B|nr:3'-5' exonuclease [Streptomyces noursei]UWS77550.1 3'-5' exonuclease [Streptomyces noursei]UWS77589.1 3'-5' exonuclease [Streptomyces noursei]